MSDDISNLIAELTKVDKTKEELIKAKNFYAAIPTEQDQLTADEYRAAIELHEEGDLERDEALALLKAHAARLKEDGLKMQHKRLIKIIKTI